MKKLTLSQVYEKSTVSNKLFWKIKNIPNYHPDKATVMKLCIGVELNMDETIILNQLLRSPFDSKLKSYTSPTLLNYQTNK